MQEFDKDGKLSTKTIMELKEKFSDLGPVFDTFINTMTDVNSTAQER